MPEEIQEWTNEFELSDDDKKTLSKYESPLLALQGGANASRLAGSPDRTIKNLETLDMEKLDDAQKESLNRHMARIRGVPSSPEGYNIERPEVMPEGMEYDNDLENWFRKEIHAAGGSNALAQRLVNNWNKRQFELYDKSENVAREVEENLLKEMNGDKDKFIEAYGSREDPNRIGNVKRCLLTASKELGLDYKDGEGFPQSHLIDCLDLRRKGGRLGDKAPLLKYVNWVWNKFMAEGGTEAGGGPSGHKNLEQERIDRNKRDFPKSTFLHR